MKNRVAASNPSAIAHINKCFGVDLAQLGSLTPEQVRAMAKNTKASAIQRQLVQTYVAYYQELISNQKEIERLTAEAIKMGLKTKEEIDKYIFTTAIASAKHDAHIQKLEHQLKQELQLVQGQLLSDKALSTANFQQRLQLLRASHQGKLQVGQASFAQRLAQIQQAPGLAIAANQRRAQFTNYINAKDYDPIPANFGGQTSPGQQGSASRDGGFLRGLLNFFSGRK